MDTDLDSMSREHLVVEVRELRDGIRKHRDSSGQDLCWHHPALWALLPERTDPMPVVPAWPQFMEGCVRYRQSLDKQAPKAPQSSEPGRSTGSLAVMSALLRLEAWYQRQCNEDWEHTYGVNIGTLDNPGWSLTVDLTDTELETVPCQPTVENVGVDSHSEGNDWVTCRVENRKWLGYGDATKLSRLIEEFVSWAEKHDS